MAAMLRIEPVPRRRQAAALALLAGPAGPCGLVAALKALLTGPMAEQCLFWWARDRTGPRAAAVTVINPGRTAVVYHSPPNTPAEVAPLARLLAELTDATLERDVAFVQSLLPVDAADDAEALLLAGYEYLTMLIYLRRPVEAGLPAPLPVPHLRWRTFQPGEERMLGELIADTYVGSQDCPTLLGRRRPEDVVEGHKASGTFRPECWFMALLGDEPVGCVLINDSTSRPGECEVVYLGVRPAWRRCGIGRAMVRRALTAAVELGRSAVGLAVDAANVPAMELYRSEGFREAGRREVYLKMAPAKA